MTNAGSLEEVAIAALVQIAAQLTAGLGILMDATDTLGFDFLRKHSYFL